MQTSHYNKMAEIVLKFCVVVLLFYRTGGVNDRYYPRYHLAPPHGWMNDPNGFSIFRNEYHLFYQYNPESSEDPGIAHWGHAKSPDLFHWQHLPIAMYPDQSYDKSGVFSGSALVEDEEMFIFYTGNVDRVNETPDHEQRQAMATSTDGINVTKYENNPIIIGEEYQPNFRDPKVWKNNDTYYMILGNSFDNDTRGRVLLYTSLDMISWEQVSVLHQSDGSLGYMWECPDFFELDGRFVLLFSPQGIEPQGDMYRNLYQTGYIVGDFDYTTNIFKPITEFSELDHGHDFYATQTIKDINGNRIMVVWMDMWEQDYPERDDGFTGMMTIPRVLSLTKNNQLIQNPVSTISAARGKLLRKGKASKNTVVTLEDKAGEIVIRARRNQTVEFYIESNNASVKISYNSKAHQLTLDRGGDDGVRRTKWVPRGSKLNLRVFVDASSIEMFAGKGEVTFSSRFFPDGNVTVRLEGQCGVESMNVFTMKRTVLAPQNDL